MASDTYNSAKVKAASGLINFAAGTFKGMLVTAAYTPDFDAHDFRNDVTNEVAGTGYTAGGKVLAVTVTQDNAGNRAVISIDPAIWEAAVITNARACVVYQSHGGAASADELVYYVDFGADKSSSGGDFTVNFTTPGYLS